MGLYGRNVSSNHTLFNTENNHTLEMDTEVSLGDFYSQQNQSAEGAMDNPKQQLAEIDQQILFHREQLQSLLFQKKLLSLSCVH